MQCSAPVQVQVQVQSSVQLLLLCCSILEQRRLHRIALATLLSNSFTHSSRGKSSRERAHIKTLLKPWKDRTKSVLAGGCIIPAAATSPTNLYFPIKENLSIMCNCAVQGAVRGKVLMQTPDMALSSPSPCMPILAPKCPITSNCPLIVYVVIGRRGEG